MKKLAYGRGKALGGGDLEGTSVSRWVYLDEGGTSRQEPCVVVAGVMIDADKDLIRIEDHLQGLVEKYIPKEDRDGFIFHATDIWSGTKYFRNKERWSLDTRLEILWDLVSIPRQFQLPITFGFVRKAEFSQEASSRMAQELNKKELSEKETDIVLHSIAFINASIIVERAMRQCWSNEVALIIAEDRDKVKNHIKEMQLFLQNTDKVSHLRMGKDVLPFKNIRDTVHFAAKRESMALQLADMCAFVTRGHLSGHSKSKPFYDEICPWMLAHPKDDQS